MIPAKHSVSPRQTLIGVFILMTLVCIAAIIFAVQFRFNPAVIEWSGSTIPSPSSSTKIATAAKEVLVKPPAGIVPLGAPEVFSPDRMSDKINGKAELYLSAGCKGLRSQRFVDSSSDGHWMEIFVFDMGSHENAFAVYSAQKRGDAVPIGLTTHDYRTQNALFLIHGGYYLEFIASEATERALAAMQYMLERFIETNRVETAAIAEPELFPTAGLDSGSVGMIAANAFGFDRLDRIFTAAYHTDDTKMTAFLSARNSAEEAAELAAAYRDFMIRWGGVDSGAQSGLDIDGASVIEIMGFTEIIFTRGAYLAGIHEAADRQSAVALARRLYDRLGDRNIAK